MFAAKLISRVAPTVSRRSISVSAARKDLVQDLYIKELKAYKTPVAAKDAHVGAVKQFTPPAVPSAPASLASTLASDLQTYDSTPVALAEASDVAAASTEGGAELDTEKMNVDELFEHLRQDVVVPVYHEDAHH